MRLRLVSVGLLGWVSSAMAGPSIVAAENFYGDLARQIAGPEASVDSILSSPDQDPHLFEASPSTARLVGGAAIAIANGVGYDPWMIKLLGAPKPGRTVINVGALLGRKMGVNPHLWYDPAAMPAAATALADALATAAPAHAADYRNRAQAFDVSLAPLREKIAAMRRRFAGQSVTATEPVFGYMAEALGLTVRSQRFQLAVMNGTEPRLSDVSAFEADLRQHRVRALLYNAQAAGPVAQRMLRIAKQAGVPVVGVTETEPTGMRYQDWMMSQLDALEAALTKAP